RGVDDIERDLALLGRDRERLVDEEDDLHLVEHVLPLELGEGEGEEGDPEEAESHRRAAPERIEAGERPPSDPERERDGEEEEQELRAREGDRDVPHLPASARTASRSSS